MEVNVHEAKTRLSQLLVKVEHGEDVIISRAGHPVARLVPYVGKNKPRVLGQAAGDFEVPEDFDAPLPDEIMKNFLE
ncbi:MAG TPA: type II toxin-antitoxin system Phd/YefM family antitoxin [Candidatus Xenobia bacterium]|jgi:prevent-host-death family protein